MIQNDVVIELFNATVEMAQTKGLLWGDTSASTAPKSRPGPAGHKSVRRKDGSDDGRDPEDWRGERRSNETHESRTYPDGSAINGQTTRHIGYEISQRNRKRIEQRFGWAKTIGPMRQVMVRKVNHTFTLTLAAYNLTRLRHLAAFGV